ncbi:uncharacterized protein TNCV_917731 [Trichonephila clavipes]|nr:uncharacterized protein TNCV_917731 [Trichonephila clavipes]
MSTFEFPELRSVLPKESLPVIKEIDYWLADDNTQPRSHTPEYLKTEIITRMDWPPKSPDFNPIPIGLKREHDILVLKPSPYQHNRNEIDDWMGIDEWNSWFKSHVRDSNMSQDVVNLNKF